MLTASLSTWHRRSEILSLRFQPLPKRLYRKWSRTPPLRTDKLDHPDARIRGTIRRCRPVVVRCKSLVQPNGERAERGGLLQEPADVFSPANRTSKWIDYVSSCCGRLSPQCSFKETESADPVDESIVETQIVDYYSFCQPAGLLHDTYHTNSSVEIEWGRVRW